MSLESFGVEALQGLFRRLVQDLSDPTLFDFDTQASIGSGAESGAASPPESYEVAASDLATLRAMPEAPGPSAFSNPRAYLEYLKFFVEERIDILSEISQTPSFELVSSDEGLVQRPTENPAESWIREYRAALADIDRELNRFGGPRTSELRELYDQVRDLQVALRQA